MTLDHKQALKQLYQHLYRASGNDKFISKKDIKTYLSKMTGPEKDALKALFKYVKAQNPDSRNRVTWKDLERTESIIEKKLIPYVIPPNEERSIKKEKELAKMGEQALLLTNKLGKLSHFLNAPAPAHLARVLAKLSTNIDPIGYHTGRYKPFEPVYIPADLKTLDGPNFLAAAQKRYRDFNYQVERVSDADRQFFFGLAEQQAPDLQLQAVQLIEYMQRFLQQRQLIILEKSGQPWHPTFVVGLLAGDIVGIRMDALW